MDIIIAILATLAAIAACVSVYFNFQNIKAIKSMMAPREEKKPEKKVEKEMSVDDKASNAERLFNEGMQNVLSFDVDTMKKYLRGDEDG